jgi:hypothetical protein
MHVFILGSQAIVPFWENLDISSVASRTFWKTDIKTNFNVILENL